MKVYLSVDPTIYCSTINGIAINIWENNINWIRVNVFIVDKPFKFNIADVSFIF